MVPSTNTCILVKSLNSKMAANMAAKTLIDLDIFNVKVLIIRSGNSVRMSQSKMAANMAAKIL